VKPSARRKARKHALQGLYQVIYTGQEAEVIAAQHLAEMNHDKIDVEYFKKLLLGSVSNLVVLDEVFAPFLDRDIGELTPVELSVLRLATYELKEMPDVPYRVVLNEALELTKKFGSTDGFKFVNGVLDKTAKAVRPDEVTGSK
jgi:transcription antitermination protein NusB